MIIQAVPTASPPSQGLPFDCAASPPSIQDVQFRDLVYYWEVLGDISRRLLGAAASRGQFEALRAAELNCDALFKGTSVDGVYDADPKKVAGATRYETVSYDTVLAKNLKVMDASAIALCRDSNIPIVVFNIRETGNLAKVLAGEGVATIVQNQER